MIALIADRFVRGADGRLMDLATGEAVALTETVTQTPAEQIARRDQCVARLDRNAAKAGDLPEIDAAATRIAAAATATRRRRAASAEAAGGAAVSEALVRTGAADATNAPDLDIARLVVGGRDPKGGGQGVSYVFKIGAGEDEEFGERVLTLVDFGLVGQANWFEALSWPEISPTIARHAAVGRLGSAGSNRAARSVTDATLAGVDSARASDLRRLYIRSFPRHARDAVMTTMMLRLGRDLRARGVIPVCATALEQWPTIVPLLRTRSVVLLAGHDGAREYDADDRPAADRLARALMALVRGLVSVAAIVVKVSARAVVAAMTLGTRPSSASLLRPVGLGTSRPRHELSFAADEHGDSGATPAAGPLYPLRPRRGERAIWRDAMRRSREQIRVDKPPSRSSLHLVHASVRRGAHVAGDVIKHANGVPLQGDAAKPARAVASAVSGGGGTGHAASATNATNAASAANVASATRSGDHGEVEIAVVTTMMSGYGAPADALIGRGRWAAACRLLRADVAALGRRGRMAEAAVASVSLGRLYLALGRIDQARRWLDHAGERSSSAGSARVIGEVLRWSGIAALDEADLERAERLLRTALAAIGPAADVDQAAAIELALARCLFWQGRFEEIVLPSIARPAAGDEIAVPVPGPGTPYTGPAAVASLASLTPIVRIERWRRAARLALVDGDLARAGDALGCACRLARGDDEGDVRREMCAGRRRPASRESAVNGSGAGLDGRGGSADLQAACHLDSARLQLAIGDWGGCDAHLRACQSLRRAPARAVRLQLLRLARWRGDRGTEARRQGERLAAMLRQPNVPKLVRLRARYLIEPHARRSSELAAFIGRYGEVALAGATTRGESPMLEAFQAVLQICHETPDDLTALARVCNFLRDRLQAASVAVYGAPPHAIEVRTVTPVPPDVSAAAVPKDAVPQASAAGSGVVRDRPTGAAARALAAPPSPPTPPPPAQAAPHAPPAPARLAIAGSTRLVSPELAARVLDSGLLITPTYRADALDAAAPIRYGGRTVGALVTRWIIDVRLDETSASALLSAAATAVAPHVRAALDRECAADAAVSPPTTATSASASASASAPAASSSRQTLGILGVSAAIDKLRQTIARVASAPFHVLIEGESGSGKELVARALHQHGPRRHRRFCAINCAALTEDLFEAELFGHTRGAFTGALTERPGLFEEADGGTLFLDEIGELSARGQAKLLRAIQHGETRRIGENMPRRVDARIVAATNRSLRKEAAAGQFRDDLLYRLDIIRIDVPPLRTRPDDVVVLARAFWEEALSRTGGRATLDPDTLAALARYHWPGNVRELHNVIMALAVHAPARGRVSSSLLPAAIRGEADPDGASVASFTRDRTRRADVRSGAGERADARKDVASDGDTKAGGSDALDLRQLFERTTGDGLFVHELTLDGARRVFEEQFVRTALARAGGHQARAARALGLSRQGLRKLMTRLGVSLTDA